MKNNLKLVVVFYITLLAFSLVVGVIYAYESLDITLIGNDFLETFKIISISNLLVEVGVVAISFLLSFILVGEVFFFLYFLIKSFTLGFLLCTFIELYAFKGILISLIYLLIHVFIFFLLFLLMRDLFKLFKVFVNVVILKKDVNSIKFVSVIKRILLTFIVFIIYNLCLYFLQFPILNLFKIIV